MDYAYYLKGLANFNRSIDFMTRFLGNVAVFDSGGRSATVTFAEREIGDVLISFESEVNNIRKEYGTGDYEVVVPKTSILAEFPVTVVDKVVDEVRAEPRPALYLDATIILGLDWKLRLEKLR